MNPIHAWVILSATLTITLECFLCLCEAVIESYSCMGNSVSHSTITLESFLCLCEAVIESWMILSNSSNDAILDENLILKKKIDCILIDAG